MPSPHTDTEDAPDAEPELMSPRQRPRVTGDDENVTSPSLASMSEIRADNFIPLPETGEVSGVVESNGATGHGGARL